MAQPPRRPRRRPRPAAALLSSRAATRASAAPPSPTGRGRGPSLSQGTHRSEAVLRSAPPHSAATGAGASSGGREERRAHGAALRRQRIWLRAPRSTAPGRAPAAAAVQGTALSCGPKWRRPPPLSLLAAAAITLAAAPRPPQFTAGPGAPRGGGGRVPAPAAALALRDSPACSVTAPGPRPPVQDGRCLEFPCSLGVGGSASSHGSDSEAAPVTENGRNNRKRPEMALHKL